MTSVYFAICLPFLALASCSTSSGVRPNIILIIVDDLRPVLRCYGDTYAITPNIDFLAEQGTIFTKAYAQQALCGPSRTSFLTSRRPDTTKLYDVHSYWRTHAGNFTTLPQYFKEHGYHTVSAGKVFHPGIVSNNSDDQPYSWSEAPYHPPTQAFKQAPVCLGTDGNLHTDIYCPVEVNKQPGGSLPDIETTEFATEWLKKRAKPTTFPSGSMQNEPFFLAVGYHKPHIPLKFPVNYLDFYPIDSVPLVPNDKLPKGMPDVAWNPWNDLRKREDIAALNVSFPYGPLPQFYARYVRQGYYAATTYVDSLVGELLSIARKLFPDTIVALIGDHGWSLGEHQEWSKYSNFEVATRVPFIISKLNAHSGYHFNKQNVFTSNLSVATSIAYKTLDKYFLNKFSEKSTYEANYIRNKLQIEKHRQNSENPTLRLIPSNYNGLVELVDLFPTLVDLAGLPFVPSCSEDFGNIDTCTEGSSLSPVLTAEWPNVYQKNNIRFTEDMQTKGAVFSQYPRPSINPSVSPDSDQPRTSEIKIMGYSMRTERFRYTAWLKFNNITCKPDFSEIYAEELYDHKVDPDENHNICGKKFYRFKKKLLLLQLMQGCRRVKPPLRTLI